MTEKKTKVEKMIDQAVKEDVQFKGSDAVPLVKLASMLPSDTPYVLSVPNPERDATTMVIGNGTNDDLFNCAMALIQWIGNDEDNVASKSGMTDHPLWGSK